MQRDEEKAKRDAETLRRANAPLLRGPIRNISDYRYLEVIETPEGGKVGMTKSYLSQPKPTP